MITKIIYQVVATSESVAVDEDMCSYFQDEEIFNNFYPTKQMAIQKAQKIAGEYKHNIFVKVVELTITKKGAARQIVHREYKPNKYDDPSEILYDDDENY